MVRAILIRVRAWAMVWLSVRVMTRAKVRISFLVRVTTVVCGFFIFI